MSVAALEDVTLHLGRQTVLDGVTVSIDAGDRLGVIGPNGAGKSTLLRVLWGELVPDAGRVSIAKDARLAYMAQESTDFTGAIRDYVLSAAPGRRELEGRLKHLEASIDRCRQEAEQLQLAEALATLHAELAELDKVYGRHEAERILAGLGFAAADMGRPLSSFSGGWQVRVRLARALYQRPDVLVLDEPTNHLDLPSVHWLDRFLAAFRGALVLTAHDRVFMNRHVGRILSFEPEGVRLYRGDYDAYLKQRAEETLHLENRIRNEEKRQKELEAFVRRFKAKSSKARQAQSKTKLIEKMEAQRVSLPTLRRTLQIDFAPTERSARVVLEMTNVNFGYQTPLFQDLSVTVQRGQRIALVGANGLGKSTLLKLLAGELAPASGRIRVGKGVELRYFAQSQAEALAGYATVLDAVWAADPEAAETRVRALCGSFLFSGNEVEKPIAGLSGGEKTRVALARILLAPGNVLLLDEPTNHLDITSASCLADSLASFDGTIIFASHNLDFAEKLSDWVLEMVPGGATLHAGSVESFLARQDAAQDAGRMAEGVGLGADKAERMAQRERDKQTARAKQAEARRWQKAAQASEVEMQRLESDLSALEAEMAAKSTDAEALRKLDGAYRNLKARLAEVEQAWLEAEAWLEDNGSRAPT